MLMGYTWNVGERGPPGRWHGSAVVEQDGVYGVGTTRDAARKQDDGTGKTKHTIWKRYLFGRNSSAVGRPRLLPSIYCLFWLTAY